MSLTSGAATITRSDSVTLRVTISSTNGGTPSGTVTFSTGSISLGSAVLAGAGGSATATLTISNAPLASGSNLIQATYSGDGSYSGSTASLTVIVSTDASGAPNLSGAANAASFEQNFAPGMIVSLFGTALAPVAAGAVSVPLPSQMAGVSAVVNGIPAPLHYVSPGQVNLQIPYEVSPNSTATLILNNNGASSATRLRIGSAAPGVFTDANRALVPVSTARRGQVIEIYATGAGAVYPLIPTGSAPASGTAVSNLPRPQGGVRVTIGGIDARLQFAGIPQGLVGVIQVNAEIPAQLPLGAQSVVVTVGGVSSSPATLTVSP
jgi:uncharacterized protein (TIGR03437 family)